MIADANKKKLNEKVIADLQNVKKYFEEIDNSELTLYKDEILTEIKGELASRYFGAEGRVEELLKYDTQFRTAYNLVSDQTIYNKLLNIK